MRALAFVGVVGFAVVAVACQPQTPLPAQAPQGGPVATPAAPPLLYGPEPETTLPPREHAGGAGFHHDDGEAGEHPNDADDDPAARHKHCACGAMAGRWRRGPGAGEGNVGLAGGQEVSRELAAIGVPLYPPQLLLRRAETIGLTPDQLNKIRQEVLGTQGRAVDLRAKIEHAKIEIARLLAAEKIDERALSAQIDEAAKGKAEMYKLRLGAMLHARTLLTPEQRQKLEERKPEHEGPKPGAGAAEHSLSDMDDGDVAF